MSDPLPSATVVLVRDAEPGLELLLLQRAPDGEGKPGPWVFPGGKVEPLDVVAGTAGSVESARAAAVRETHEEAGIALDPEALRTISRWITPDVSPKRFDTWFFLSGLPATTAISVDGDEMVDHRWLTPADALAAQTRSEIRLPPPTFVTITWLSEFPTARQALAELPQRDLIIFRPRICRTADGAVMLYPGDAGYEAGEPDTPGSRHRVWASQGWQYRYERGP